MALAFGEKTVSKAYLGEKAVSAIYLGTKKVFPDEELPASGDIRLRIETTSANQTFPLFYRIMTEEGGYVSIDWGDGNKETFSGETAYSPKHTYAEAGEYVVKLTGSKFTVVRGINDHVVYKDFKDAVREILSLKMPTDSTGVHLYNTFFYCPNLTGSIPAWDNCITNAQYTYQGCTGLTGSIPEWGANITDASGTYWLCRGLTGSIPEWGANITNAYATYSDCTGLMGSIPEWGANITNAGSTYRNCASLTACSEELLQDPMPSRITSHDRCVEGCADAIRQHFTSDWGGTKAS